MFSCPPGCRRRRAASLEVPGAQGKPRAPEWWPESSGRGLDDDFLIKAFSCSRPSLKDRVLRLLAEASQSSQLSAPRTGDDISRGSGGSGGLSFIAPNASPRDRAKFFRQSESRATKCGA